MTVFLFVGADFVSIRANMPLPWGGEAGGFFRSRVRPGQSFRHYTYEMLRQMGNGPHELTFPEPTPAEPGSAENGTGQDTPAIGH